MTNQITIDDLLAPAKTKGRNKILDVLENELSKSENMPIEDKVELQNQIKLVLKKYSPMASEPVDCVLWVKNDIVIANDYNPNSVAPPEMKLLEHSIQEDGYTQPIVSWSRDSIYEVIDGFHRHRVGKESAIVSKRVHNYLPVVDINSNRQEKGDRIASTIRHNRARGKHKIDAMSDIVIELKRRNWKDERICKELGMDLDEVLRLCQITGLADIFKDQEFSKSWEAVGEVTESDFKEFGEHTEVEGEEEFRTVNTGDEKRIFHTYEKWECFKAGFYESSKEGMTKDQCQEAYKTFLSDISRFKKALGRVIVEWKNSCEHYLTNPAMNRIAWLGQASMCIETGVPAEFRGGYFLLSEKEQKKADEVALVYLNKWLKKNDLAEVSMQEAISEGRQSAIY